MQPCGQDFPGGVMKAEPRQGGDLFTRPSAQGGVEGGGAIHETRGTKHEVRAANCAAWHKRTNECACVRRSIRLGEEAKLETLRLRF